MIIKQEGASQSGFAALVITFTLVTILSLLTIGFAQLIRNESKQTLNRQLSSQAYYAAESGINDAIEAINNGFSGNKTYCATPNSMGVHVKGSEYIDNNNVDSTAIGSPSPTQTQWSCLLIDTSPGSVDYTAIDTTNPTVFTAQAVDRADGSTPVAVKKITVAWQDTDATKITFRPSSGVTNTSFPPAATWKAPGVLRLAFTPLGALDRASLAQNTYTAFLYPNGYGVKDAPGSSTYSNDQTQNGSIIDGNCNVQSAVTYSRFCVVSITIPGAGFPAGPQLFFNLRSIYSKTSAHITINDGNARLLGAQTMVDSTGKSQDVLKRIQVRVPTTNKYSYPGFSLESVEGICKTISAYPGFASGCGY